VEIKTVAQLWQEWDEHVLPAARDFSPKQHNEMRKVFYSGFFSCLHNQLTTVGEAEVTEDRGVEIMQALYDECAAFLRQGVAMNKLGS
jgi:hypothetical protein